MYKKLDDVKDALHLYRANGVQRGYSIGWKWEMLPLTIKKGSTTYLGAAPHSGKTELIFEILINLSCIHGLKHAIFSPETGTPEEVYAELCHKYIGKSYVNNEWAMSERERERAEYFISQHFIVVDPVDEDLTITQFYSLVDEIENDFGRIDTTLIDPWNELTEELIPEDLGREDKYLSRILGYCRKNARKTDRHNFVVNHVRDQATRKQDQLVYFPMPSARDMAGGQVWFRKGMLMLMSWRPPQGYLHEGRPAEPNELHLKIAKSKPKGVSQNGIYEMYYDIEKQKYYLKYDGKRIYADRGEHNMEEVAQREEPIKKEIEKLTLNEHRNDNFEEENSDYPF